MKLIETIIHFTPREREAMLLFQDDFVYKEIAGLMSIAEETVKGMTKAIFKKINVHSICKMVRWMKEHDMTQEFFTVFLPEVH